MMEETMIEILAKSTNDGAGEYTSLADLFLQTSRELAQSDAKMFRSIDRHLKQTKEILRRAEVESEDSDSEISIHSLYNFKEIVKIKGGSLFSNKAIRGSRLPLYDFFHSWKIHLS